MSKPWLEYLRHIREEAEYLLESSEHFNQISFLADATIKRAFVRSLEIIGEATKKLPNSVRETYPEIEWRAMAGMRDRLIHDYIAVDYELVWDVVQNKIPGLLEKVDQILEENT